MLGSLGILAFAFVARSIAFLLVAGVLVVLILGGTVGARLAQNRRDKRRRRRIRRNYTAAVRRARTAAWQSAVLQHDAALGLYPDIAGLLDALQEQGALWERRPGRRGLRDASGSASAAFPPSCRSPARGSTATRSANPEADLRRPRPGRRRGDGGWSRTARSSCPCGPVVDRRRRRRARRPRPRREPGSPSTRRHLRADRPAGARARAGSDRPRVGVGEVAAAYP